MVPCCCARFDSETLCSGLSSLAVLSLLVSPGADLLARSLVSFPPGSRSQKGCVLLVLQIFLWSRKKKWSRLFAGSAKILENSEDKAEVCCVRSFLSPAPHHSFGPRVFASPNNTRASPPRGSEADDSGPPPPAAVVLFPIPLPGTPLLAALLSSPPLQTLRKVTEARACAQPPGHAVPRTKRV